ncbi:MAG: hypothetical protein C0481_01415 [Phenylobacterium sp.]|uniref:BamA/TamA family outer membrane protein n=1 Tax=Phenylobacterium sp. TaxID=1871053 RepID=UPI0025D9E277|nr:BamA/TamA family outer membrane protein [Phenylobacterium sp.]MBA4010500.1 hypothetical protein [Phenylobacterium sp.]
MRVAVVAFCLALASPALADEAAPSPDEGVPPAKPFSFVAMPIPVSNPAIGNGLAVAALGIYTHDKSAPPWVTGVGGLYTDTTSWAAFAGQQANFRQDAIRLTIGAGGGDFHLDFYGVGAGAGARNRAIPIDQQGGGAVAEALFRVRPHTYLGLRYRGIALKTNLDFSQIPFPDLALPKVELDSASSALGLAAEYDTRDNQFAPRRGAYVTSQWLLADQALSSDFDYSRFELAANAYHALSAKAVVAARLAVCDSGDGAPFFDLCLFGQNNDLRGYDPGRYRDHTLVSAQVEYRRDLFWRIGAVAFAGVGGVAPSFDKLGSTLLPAVGVGLRLKASKAHNVNASFDFAFGEDSQAFYFYIGEAF